MSLLHAQPEVEIGQRYRQAGGGAGVWVVVGFAADHAANPHARLALESEPTRIITIAFAALRDRALYERVAESGEAGEES